MKAATGPNRQQQVSSATKAYPAALAETKCREVAAARAFNEAVVANLTHNGGRNLTFKHPSHLKAYNKHLVHTVSQAHAAGVQAAVEAASDPQQQQLDLEEVLGTILRECVQHAGSFQDLPPGLQALANAVRRELPAGDNAAAAAEDGANRDVIGAATLDMSPPAAAAAAGAATVGTSAAKAGSRSASKAAASSALAATATAGDGRANRQAAVAAGVAAAGGGDGAGSMSAAAAAAAAGGGTGSSRLPSGGLGAFAALRQPPPGGHSSKKSSKATAAGYGKGKGGKGGSKVCVPCTQLKRSGDGAKLTVAAAKVHPAAVVMDGDHQKAPEQDGCPFCKCSVCKKQWGDKQVQPADYTKAVACPKNRHYKPKRS